MYSEAGRQLARQLTVAARRRQPDPKTVPIELVVGPSDGRHSIDDAYCRAARFVLRNCGCGAEDGRTSSGAEELLPVGLQKQFKGQTVCLRFTIEDTRLYAFQID